MRGCVIPSQLWRKKNIAARESSGAIKVAVQEAFNGSRYIELLVVPCLCILLLRELITLFCLLTEGVMGMRCKFQGCSLGQLYLQNTVSDQPIGRSLNGVRNQGSCVLEVHVHLRQLSIMLPLKCHSYTHPGFLFNSLSSKVPYGQSCLSLALVKRSYSSVKVLDSGPRSSI